MLDKIKYYFEDALWNFPLRKERGWRRFRFKWLRIAYLAARGFYQDKCSLGASSLTYYTLVSVVPILAMAFAILRGFGYDQVFREDLLSRFQDQSGALVQLFKYADAFLQTGQGTVIAGISIGILLFTVAFLLSSLEGILNQIWGVKSLRSWKRILSDYFALMLIAPVVFLFASSASVFVLSHPSLVFFAKLVPLCLFWMLFTFIFLFMPNKRVHFISASLGGLFSACLYLFIQWSYLYFQIGVSSYGVIYGSMAALPLFLIWVQVSWFIILLGAEISYAHQTLEEHEFEGKAACVSHSCKRLLSLWIVHLSLKEFLTRDKLVHSYQIPNALAESILHDLVQCGILHESDGGYTPDQEAQNLKISDVVEALETKGESDFPFIESKALAPFERALSQFKAQIESSPDNLRLSHVSHPF